MKKKMTKKQFYFGTKRKLLQDLPRHKVIENKKKKAKKEACRNCTQEEYLKIFYAELAQLVVQLICNQQVDGSSPSFSLYAFNSIGQSNRLLSGKLMVQIH